MTTSFSSSASVSKKLALCLAAAGLLSACQTDEPAPQAGLTRAELLDPRSCKACHPKHYREWQSSMHAYASKDPVFIAMNRRGQRETEGQLGDHCVRCHAPMALSEGATRDGLDLDAVPEHLQGVTCYFCHNAVGVGEHFNNGLRLANDRVMRGGITDPVHSEAHPSAYSMLHDRNRVQSTELCGSCHDVMNTHGVHLERTLAEYKASLFSKSEGFDTCQGCHMDALPGRAAQVGGAPSRQVHEHLWPGVDVALTPFFDEPAQKRAIECALALNTRIRGIEHDGFGGFKVAIETNAGHSQPSGAAQDRRLWVEFVAYAANGSVIFESGRVAAGEMVDKPSSHANYDRNLKVFRDWIYDEHGEEIHMFWEAAPSPGYPNGYRSVLLPAAPAAGVPHTLIADYQLAGAASIARVSVRLLIRPIDHDVLEDLQRTGDLAPGFAARVPTFTLHGASVEWIPGRPNELRSLWPDDLKCPEAYRCLLEDSATCAAR
jgi:hypothetical protein